MCSGHVQSIQRLRLMPTNAPRNLFLIDRQHVLRAMSSDDVRCGVQQHWLRVMPSRNNNDTARHDSVLVGTCLSSRDERQRARDGLHTLPCWPVQQHGKCSAMHIVPAWGIQPNDWRQQQQHVPAMPTRNFQ